MKRSFIIGAAAAVALFASAPSYAALGWNGLGFNGLGFNGLGFNTNQAAAAGQPGLNLTFDGVTLATGETLAAK